VESFNARLRDELFNIEVFTSLAEAKVLAGDWREDYNTNHPYSALGMMSPERFAASPRSPSGLTTRGGEGAQYSVKTSPGLSYGVDR
jgi:putative transposase